MAATSLYHNLNKLGRVALPSGTEYALIDYNGRELITQIFNTAASYQKDDYVIYEDELYRFIVDKAAGPWDSTAVRGPITVGDELNRLESTIAGGVHYVGKTTTSLYDWARTNPIVIGGNSYTAKAGDMVIYDWSSSLAYQSGVAYSANTYLAYTDAITRTVIHGITNQNISAEHNTDWESISEAVDILTSEPEFLFDGTVWNTLGQITALGDLAFKDSVLGTYDEVRSATVTVSVPLPMSGKMGQTTITGVGGTESVSKMTAGTAKDIAKAGTAVRYGTADVGEAITYGTADRASTATTVGNANVGTAVVYGKANVGEPIQVATAGLDVVYGKANVGSAVTYGTANPGTTYSSVAQVGETHSGLARAWTSEYTSGAVTCTVSGDCLSFSAPTTDSVIGALNADGVSITSAVASNTTLTPAVAAPTTQTLTAVGGTVNVRPAVTAPNTQTITPAVASSTSIYGAVSSSKTLTPAVAAPNDQTIVPAVANGSITPWTETAKTVATAAASATTVGTGTIDLISGTGSEVLTGLSSTTETKTVTLNKQTSPIVSK